MKKIEILFLPHLARLPLAVVSFIHDKSLHTIYPGHCSIDAEALEAWQNSLEGQMAIAVGAIQTVDPKKADDAVLAATLTMEYEWLKSLIAKDSRSNVQAAARDRLVAMDKSGFSPAVGEYLKNQWFTNTGSRLYADHFHLRKSAHAGN